MNRRRTKLLVLAALLSFLPTVAAGSAVLPLEFPHGLSPGIGGGLCTETDSGLSCSYSFGSQLPDYGSVAILGITASEAGTYTVRGSVTADQPDPVASNNSDSAVVIASPAADLSVQIMESADPAIPGQPLTYAVTITNHGPSPASAVTLTDTWSSTVPGGVQLLSFGATQGQCTQTVDRSIDCLLGELASGATATVTIRLRPRGIGSVDDQAQVPPPSSTRTPPTTPTARRPGSARLDHAHPTTPGLSRCSSDPSLNCN